MTKRRGILATLIVGYETKTHVRNKGRSRRRWKFQKPPSESRYGNQGPTKSAWVIKDSGASVSPEWAWNSNELLATNSCPWEEYKEKICISQERATQQNNRREGGIHWIHGAVVNYGNDEERAAFLPLSSPLLFRALSVHLLAKASVWLNTESDGFQQCSRAKGHLSAMEINIECPEGILDCVNIPAVTISRLGRKYLRKYDTMTNSSWVSIKIFFHYLDCMFR